MEETTRASSHYLASSIYQRLLSHSNRSFAAGDRLFKMEIACYGYLSYASLMMMSVINTGSFDDWSFKQILGVIGCRTLTL